MMEVASGYYEGDGTSGLWAPRDPATWGTSSTPLPPLTGLLIVDPLDRTWGLVLCEVGRPLVNLPAPPRVCIWGHPHLPPAIVKTTIGGKRWGPREPPHYGSLLKGVRSAKPEGPTTTYRHIIYGKNI